MDTDSTKLQLAQYLENYLSQKRMKIKELSIQEVNKNNLFHQEGITLTKVKQAMSKSVDLSEQTNTISK